MTAGFSITCPSLERLVKQMTVTDPYEVYATAAGQAALDYEEKLAANASDAGAPPEVVSSISNYVHQPSGLVMVGPSEDQAEAAQRHEVGSPYTAPGGWQHRTHVEHGAEARNHFRQALNYHLDRTLMER